MNYGYDERTPGWKPAKATELADEFRRAIRLRPELRSKSGSGPYIEVDVVYPGMRLRRLGNVPDLMGAVQVLDAIYAKVMEVEES